MVSEVSTSVGMEGKRLDTAWNPGWVGSSRQKKRGPTWGLFKDPTPDRSCSGRNQAPGDPAGPGTAERRFRRFKSQLHHVRAGKWFDPLVPQFPHLMTGLPHWMGCNMPEGLGPRASCDDSLSRRAPAAATRVHMQPWKPSGLHTRVRTLACIPWTTQSPPRAKINTPGLLNDSPALAGTRFLEQVTTGRAGGPPESGRDERVQVPACPATP